MISRKACRWTRSVEYLFHVGLLQRVSSFLSHLIVCKSWNPCRKLSTMSTSKNYSPYAQRVLTLTRLDACVVEPRRRFVTGRGKKEKKKRNLKFKPRPLCQIDKMRGLKPSINPLSDHNSS